MTVDPLVQARFERNLTWKRSWPRCFLGIAATVEIFIGLVIFLTEFFNILMDFWHMNIFGGIWTSIIILINWILIYVTVCCATTIRASKCAFIWNIITLVALGVLITFDIIFILNPYTCVLTPTCSTQPQLISLNPIIQLISPFNNYTYLTSTQPPVVSFNSIMQLISPFKNYTSYDSKKFFLEIQVGCAGVAFIISLIYIFIYIARRIKITERIVQDYPAPAIAHPPPVYPPPPHQHEFPIANAPPPPPPPPNHHEFPIANAPPTPWATKVPYAPYAPY